MRITQQLLDIFDWCIDHSYDYQTIDTSAYVSNNVNARYCIYLFLLLSIYLFEPFFFSNGETKHLFLVLYFQYRETKFDLTRCYSLMINAVSFVHATTATETFAMVIRLITNTFLISINIILVFALERNIDRPLESIPLLNKTLEHNPIYSTPILIVAGQCLLNSSLIIICEFWFVILLIGLSHNSLRMCLETVLMQPGIDIDNVFVRIEFDHWHVNTSISLGRCERRILGIIGITGSISISSHESIG
jgi:hypothetical protein